MDPNRVQFISRSAAIKNFYTEINGLFTTKTRIHFVFPFIFKFGSSSEVLLTKALICTRKQNPEKQIAYYVALLTYRSKCPAWTPVYHVSKRDMKPSILDFVRS